MKVSNAIYKISKKYKISANLYAAILMQESRYSLIAKGCSSGLQKIPGIFGTEYQEIRVCSDFGIAMINYKTARNLNININRLTIDLEYAIEAGARVLVGIQKHFGHKETDWWVRYNCGYKGTTQRTSCIIYKNLTERYLRHF